MPALPIGAHLVELFSWLQNRFDNGCPLVFLVPRPTFKTFSIPGVESLCGCGGRGVGDGPFDSPLDGFLLAPPLTHMVYRLPFSSYFAGSKSVSARPSVRPPRIR